MREGSAYVRWNKLPARKHGGVSVSGNPRPDTNRTRRPGGGVGGDTITTEPEKDGVDTAWPVPTSLAGGVIGGEAGATPEGVAAGVGDAGGVEALRFGEGGGSRTPPGAGTLSSTASCSSDSKTASWSCATD